MTPVGAPGKQGTVKRMCGCGDQSKHDQGCSDASELEAAAALKLDFGHSGRKSVVNQWLSSITIDLLSH